jgi:hypothetical protein
MPPAGYTVIRIGYLIAIVKLYNDRIKAIRIDFKDLSFTKNKPIDLIALFCFFKICHTILLWFSNRALYPINGTSGKKISRIKITLPTML